MIVKLLVCTDGSENSLKCVKVAARMAGSCDTYNVALIYVHDGSLFLPNYWQGKYPFTTEEEEQLKKIDKRIVEERQKIFADALKMFENSAIEVRTIFKVGHPAEVIADEAAKGNYDIVVIGRRGTGGVKKLFMGSVSSTVLQLVKTNILIVK